MSALINLDAARPAVSGAPSLSCWLYHTTVTPHVLARKGQIAVRDTQSKDTWQSLEPRKRKTNTCCSIRLLIEANRSG